MAKTVSIDQLDNEITRLMAEYTEDITIGVEQATNKTAKQILNEVKANARHWGWSDKYVNGFTKSDQSTPGSRKYVVWNRKYPGLVHLLEDGHALWQGGRARAYPHIYPAVRENIPTYEKLVEKIIKSGG